MVSASGDGVVPEEEFRFGLVVCQDLGPNLSTDEV